MAANLEARSLRHRRRFRVRRPGGRDPAHQKPSKEETDSGLIRLILQRPFTGAERPCLWCENARSRKSRPFTCERPAWAGSTCSRGSRGRRRRLTTKDHWSSLPFFHEEVSIGEGWSRPIAYRSPSVRSAEASRPASGSQDAGKGRLAGEGRQKLFDVLGTAPGAFHRLFLSRRPYKALKFVSAFLTPILIDGHVGILPCNTSMSPATIGMSAHKIVMGKADARPCP